MRTQFEVSAPKNLPVATRNSPKPARSCQTMKNASTRAAASSAIIMAMEAVRCALNIRDLSPKTVARVPYFTSF